MPDLQNGRDLSFCALPRRFLSEINGKAQPAQHRTGRGLFQGADNALPGLRYSLKRHGDAVEGSISADRIHAQIIRQIVDRDGLNRSGDG